MMKDSKHKMDFLDISVEYHHMGSNYMCDITFKDNNLDDMATKFDYGFNVRYWQGNTSYPHPSLSKTVNQLIVELKINKVRNIKDVVGVSKKFFDFKHGSHNIHDFILKSL